LIEALRNKYDPPKAPAKEKPPTAQEDPGKPSSQKKRKIQKKQGKKDN
jgi:hypothetical protein